MQPKLKKTWIDGFYYGNYR